MSLSIFAHEGEVHATNTAAQFHYLQEWYIALPLYILGVILVWFVTYRLSHSKPGSLLAIAAVSLVTGVLLYTTSAVVSIVALASGLGITLTTVLLSLQNLGDH